MKGVKDIGDPSNKKILLRVDFNVPIENGRVVEDYRIKKVLPTINFLQERGAKVILLSHLEDKDKNVLTLKPIFEYLKNIFPDISFVSNFSDLEKISNSMKAGDLVLFENLRFNDGEKKNDERLVRQLASLGDIYVNEAFSVSHREHASIVGLPNFLPGFAGLLFEEEVRNLSSAFSPEHPFLFILGGAKTETKLPLLEKFLDSADNVFAGGVLANDFFKARGFEVGQSFVSKEQKNYSHPAFNGMRVFLPEEVLVVGDDGKQVVKSADGLNENDSIKDVFIKDFGKLEEIISRAKFILWNGPMGNLEEGFSQGTKDLAEIITKSSAKTIIGGGDTLSALDESVLEKFSFVSTGGGAMLDYLANETLPGIEVL